MKTRLLLLLTLLSSALAREAEPLSPVAICDQPGAIIVVCCTDTTKAPPAPVPANPAPRPTGKSRGQRPKLPAHLFM